MHNIIGVTLLLILVLSGSVICAQEAPWYEHPKDYLTVKYDTLQWSYDGSGDSLMCCATVTMQYSVIDSAPSEAIKDSINSIIMSCLMRYAALPEGSTLDERANKEIEEFKKSRAFDIREAESGGPSTSWITEISASVAYLDHGILSVGVGWWAYTGGAHPGGSSSTSHFDLSSFAQIRVADLFSDSCQPKLDSIGEVAFCKTMHLPSDVPLDSLRYFVWQKGKFFLPQDFAITDSGLVFSYDDYEIASYAKGRSAAFIDWSSLRPIINPTGPLGWVLREK